MSTHPRWFGSLSWRLLAAFLMVAVGAVALLALVAAVSVDRRTADLAATQRAALRAQVASALAAAYTSGRGSWQSAQVAGVGALATAQGAQLTVLDHTGHQVWTGMTDGHDSWQPSTAPLPAPTAPGPGTATRWPSPAPGSTHHPENNWPSTSPTAARSVMPNPWHSDTGMTYGGHDHALPAAGGTALPFQLVAATRAAAGASEPVTIPILVGGRQVGTARLTLPTSTDTSIAAARAALLRTLGVGTLAAVLLATAVAAVVTRRVARPLVALTDATRAFAAGDPHPDRLLRPAPGELGEVGRAFTAMAASLRQQDEVRRAVVADVAHELRTPVTILRGQTEQLLDGLADPTPARLVSLHDEVLRLEHLTDDLATLSAADAAGLALHTTPVDLGKLATGVVDAMSPQFADAELGASVDADDNTVVLGDPTRLTQVITNLLSNAVKFTPAGGTITLTVHRDRDDAALTVADTGPGIAAEELPHVFERFWRGRTAASRSGTGIGLAVVQALVTAHHGSVTVSSPPTGGTRFTVRLPATG